MDSPSQDPEPQFTAARVAPLFTVNELVPLKLMPYEAVRSLVLAEPWSLGSPRWSLPSRAFPALRGSSTHDDFSPSERCFSTTPYLVDNHAVARHAAPAVSGIGDARDARTCRCGLCLDAQGLSTEYEGQSYRTARHILGHLSPVVDDVIRHGDV